MADLDRNFLNHCKLLIEQRLKWIDSDDWKQRDFEDLGELIYQKTKVLLSLSTLRRIWKKDFTGLPHPGTLNALAQFLDYTDWKTFKQAQRNYIKKTVDRPDDTIQTPSESKPIRKAFRLNFLKSPRILIPLLALLLLIPMLIIFIPRIQSKQSYANIIFTSKKSVTSGVPNTVIFNYDISPLKVDSVTIQQSWDERRRARVARDKHYHTSVYYYPGFHKAKLMIGDEIIKEHFIHVNTDGWLVLARYKMDDEIPLYIRDNFIDAGRLYVSPETLKNNKLDLSESSWWVSFYNVQTFDSVDGDYFTLETRVKNDLAEGGLTGQYFWLILMCEQGRMLIPLTEPGCVGNISIRFLENGRLGTENDLSMFGCNMAEWNSLRCINTQKSVRIELNDKSIYQMTYTTSAGKIIGIHLIFHGCGAVDWVYLKNEREQIVFADEFGA